MPDPFASSPLARPLVRDLGASRIREVANAGMGKSDVLAFWFGEPDAVTPPFIREAAVRALEQGDTFYTQNTGMPALRAAIADYLTHLHAPIGPERVAVTSSGVSALMLLAQLILDPGDRVVAVTPLWPNLVEIPRILGAQVTTVSLQRRPATTAAPAKWQLDLQQLLDALTPDTRAVFINSPNNPTGWMMDAAQQREVLAHCRRHGIWILSDDVYERLVYPDTSSSDARLCAPSFLDIAEAQDRLVSANSFSKSWLMTGWRLGWAVVPEAMMGDLGKLLEYNTSCAPGFVQQAGLAALEGGEPVLRETVAHYRAARDFLYDRLTTSAMRDAGIVAPRPDAAMYLFFGVQGEPDSVALCKRLVAEAGLGLAPGSAFGPDGEGSVRWCFANRIARLADGVERLERFLARRAA